MSFWAQKATRRNEARADRWAARNEARGQRISARADKYRAARVERGERTPFRSNTFVTFRRGR